MELKLRKHGEVYVIDIIGELDLYNADKLRTAVGRLTEKQARRLIINLENVGYIDSSGIGTLINCYSTARRDNWALYLASVRGPVRKVMELTRLLGFFPLADSVEEAVLALSRSEVR